MGDRVRPGTAHPYEAKTLQVLHRLLFALFLFCAHIPSAGFLGLYDKTFVHNRVKTMVCATYADAEAVGSAGR